VYSFGAITQETAIVECEKILVAFPKMERQMLKLLRDRFNANGFTDQRMTDAINSVIDNYSGFDKLPAIGDFVRFDKKVKTFTLSELKTKHKDAYYMGATYDPIAVEYGSIKVDGQLRYAKKEDITKYNL
jgi:hypothetical protein